MTRLKHDKVAKEARNPRGSARQGGLDRLGLKAANLAAVCGLALSICGPLLAKSADWPVLKTYEGEFLRRVKMPLGGIGTGTVSLNGRGGLVDWAVRNSPAIGWTPTVHGATTAFWLRTEDAQGRVSMRILEGPADTELYEGGAGAMFPNHGFPHFRTSVFRAAYPLARVELGDPQMPVAVTLEAVNPLVPGDADASGIPAALLRWRLVNKTECPLKVSVLGFLVNAAGGELVKGEVSSDVLRGISIGSKDVAPVDSTLGRLVLAVPPGVGAISTAQQIANLGWRVKLDSFWRQFASLGKAASCQDPDSSGDLAAAAMSVSFDLPAKGEKSLPFVLAWRFPHRMAWDSRMPRGQVVNGPFDPNKEVGNWYATRFATAEAAAETLMRNLPELEAKTVAFVRGILSAKAPDVVKEAALFNLSTVRSETCFRTADGNFFGWEGIFDDAGSCFGSCAHVWGYEHVLVDLWPNLAKNMTDIYFSYAMEENGKIAFRTLLPLDPQNAKRGIAAADGQLHCLLKVYENWRKTGDDDWLRRLWPKAKKALEFCWVPGGWDADRDGVMEGCQHNTMDVEYYGPNPQMEFLYLAALKAVGEMADFLGDVSFAAMCRGLAERGSAWTEANLFNGAYYEHRVVPPVGPIAPGLSGGNARDLSNPDFQLAAGCLVDQLLGDVLSRHLGLGQVADEAHARTTTATILEKCASDNVGPRYNCGRDYAFPEEPALKMAWYPEGRMPRKPFPYYGENMTGFEYVVAAGLAQQGDFAAAEKVVRDIRSRYDGRKRNPFDEAECGHHYVRALASWMVLKAFDNAGKKGENN